MATSSSQSYATIKRSATSKRPFIDLDPVRDSLTDGTNIPPPAPEPQPPPPKPAVTSPIGRKPVPPLKDAQSPVKEKPRLDVATAAAAAAVRTHTHAPSPSGGPLRSHPVTPIDTQVNGAYFESFAQRPPQPTATTSAASPRHAAGMSQHLDSSRTSAAQENVRPPPTEQESHSRKSSFARFFRLRSLSSLRSRNSSQLTLSHFEPPSQESEHQGRRRKSSDLFGTASRGTKRPASPNPADTLNNAEANSGGTQSFPRMMRKKSMDFFGTARRKSGLWTSGGEGQETLEQSAMNEEARRETMRERADTTQSARPASRMSAFGFDGSAMSIRSGRRSSLGGRKSSSLAPRESLAVPREPPPRLPELTEHREIEEDLFSSIGRE